MQIKVASCGETTLKYHPQQLEHDLVTDASLDRERQTPDAVLPRSNWRHRFHHPPATPLGLSKHQQRIVQ